ncbi:hypothetical protein S7711_10632 [Stachybotrys chartarum IBT 7711]|uniref:Uncharacterized protein n=1 Tax=Stachybotrys chartarum (strain CBS 109288 / IBT 7711) TaxID=1280523 RepID=A0A084AH27_STACB|nr:hypothetical protein S7711_10632 [Stachybotrys chartarum IBT 7711]
MSSARPSSSSMGARAKPTQVMTRTSTQHDRRAPEPRRNSHGPSELIDDEGFGRPVSKRSRRGGVEGRVDVAPRKSRADYSSRETHPHWEDPMPRIESRALMGTAAAGALVPGRRPQPERIEEPRPRRRQIQAPDSDLRFLGAWSESGFVRHRETPTEFISKKPYVDPVFGKPHSPGEGRLPTPDLVHMPGSGFCSCCVDTQDQINEAWYLAGRAKMDAQLGSAMAHINQMTNGGVRRLE